MKTDKFLEEAIQSPMNEWLSFWRSFWWQCSETESLKLDSIYSLLSSPKLNWMDAIRKQASKLREQVARQQQVRYRRSFRFLLCFCLNHYTFSRFFFSFATLRCYFAMQFSFNSSQRVHNLVVIIVLVNMIPQSIRSNRISYLHCENQ